MSEQEQVPSDQMFPPKEIWVVLFHSDLSGVKAFSDKGAAVRYARQVCVDNQYQVFLCECKPFAKLTRTEPKMEPA